MVEHNIYRGEASMVYIKKQRFDDIMKSEILVEQKGFNYLIASFSILFKYIKFDYYQFIIYTRYVFLRLVLWTCCTESLFDFDFINYYDTIF